MEWNEMKSAVEVFEVMVVKGMVNEEVEGNGKW